jgi:hypothetical protein
MRVCGMLPSPWFRVCRVFWLCVNSQEHGMWVIGTGATSLPNCKLNTVWYFHLTKRIDRMVSLSRFDNAPHCSTLIHNYNAKRSWRGQKKVFNKASVRNRKLQQRIFNLTMVPKHGTLPWFLMPNFGTQTWCPTLMPKLDAQPWCPTFGPNLGSEL